MRPAALILNARSRGWRAAWQRLVVSEVEAPRTVVLSDSLTESLQYLRQWPSSWVAIELRPETLGDVLCWIARVESEFPQAAVGVLMDGGAGLLAREAALREAGAVHCCDSIPKLTEVASLVRRHLNRVGQSPHQDPLNEMIAAAAIWPSDAAEPPEMLDAD